MLAAGGLPDSPVVKQLLEWVAELENHRPQKKRLPEGDVPKNPARRTAGNLFLCSGAESRAYAPYVTEREHSTWIHWTTTFRCVCSLTAAGRAACECEPPRCW